MSTKPATLASAGTNLGKNGYPDEQKKREMSMQKLGIKTKIYIISLSWKPGRVT